MAGLKEIELRLRSVQNTKKITYAMKLVAAAKLRKAQEAVQRSRAYTEALSGLLGELGGEIGSSDSVHPLMVQREEIKKIRIVVVGGGRGLCGGYNTNVNRKTDAAYKELKAAYPNASIDAVILGRKPAEYFRRIDRPTARTMEDLGEDALRWPIDEICRQLESEFISGEVDAVYLIYTRFKSALSHIPMLEKILPLDPDEVLAAAPTRKANEHEDHSTPGGTALFEPSPVAVFSALLPRILRSKIRQAALDAKASETGARMTAMDAATKNAGELIHNLTRLRNKLRQGKITSQLLDIVGGAEALN